MFAYTQLSSERPKAQEAALFSNLQLLPETMNMCGLDQICRCGATKNPGGKLGTLAFTICPLGTWPLLPQARCSWPGLRTKPGGQPFCSAYSMPQAGFSIFFICLRLPCTLLIDALRVERDMRGKRGSMCSHMQTRSASPAQQCAPVQDLILYIRQGDVGEESGRHGYVPGLTCSITGDAGRLARTQVVHGGLPEPSPVGRHRCVQMREPPDQQRLGEVFTDGNSREACEHAHKR